MATHSDLPAVSPLLLEPAANSCALLCCPTPRSPCFLSFPNCVQVSYSHSSLGLLQKPLLLVGVLAAVFGLAILAGRGSLASSPSVRSVVAKPHAS